MISDADRDIAMADSSASSLSLPGLAEEEQQYRGLDTRAITAAQDRQEPSFGDRVARHIGVKSKESRSDVLLRGKGPQLQLTSIPSTPPSRRPAPSDLSPATPPVRRRLFSSPAIPLEFPDENRPPGSLGLGITGSPSSGRAQTHIRKNIAADRAPQAKHSVLAIKESMKSDPTSDAEKHIDQEKHRKRSRKQSQRRLQRKNKKKRIRIKMEMKNSREKNTQLPVQSSHDLNSHNPTATSQLHSHPKAPGDESPCQIAASSLPLGQISSSRYDAAKQAIASSPSVSDTDSDSRSGSDRDVDAELFDHVKLEPPKLVVTAYRGYVPPYGGDYNYHDYYNACIRDHERLLKKTQQRNRWSRLQQGN